MESDIAVLRELCGSVYLTTVQRGALRRLLASREVLRSVSEDARVPLSVQAEIDQAMAHGEEASSAIEEEQRHALLGPCGAE